MRAGKKSSKKRGAGTGSAQELSRNAARGCTSSGGASSGSSVAMTEASYCPHPQIFIIMHVLYSHFACHRRHRREIFSLG